MGSVVTRSVEDGCSLRVEWVNGNQQWMIVGGGLPRGAAWDGFDSREEALREARAIAEDICVEVVA
jgi:hypothetical protein